MGESLLVLRSSKKLQPRISTSGKLLKIYLSDRCAAGIAHWTREYVASVKESVVASGAVDDIAIFLITTAALEIVRRFSKSMCPFLWRGLQALQLLFYPPFDWIHKWFPFMGFVKKFQTFSRPMLVLSIGTLFSNQLSSTIGISYGFEDAQRSCVRQSEPSFPSSALNEGSGSKALKTIASEPWLLELYKELKMQGITVPERISKDELRRFYDVSDGNFSRFLSSVIKTIHWRQNYKLLPQQELNAWLHLVFWHGYDEKQRPCLIIRIGLACSSLTSNDRSMFVRAVVSQMEHGVLNLIDEEHTQLTVLMDCEGLSPFGLPLQTMRSCAILLQDHYPNRLGYLFVVRLPPIARLITQTLFQALKPATRRKLRILGDNYRDVLSENISALPPSVGGNCSCLSCSGNESPPVDKGTVSVRPTMDPAEETTAAKPDCNRYASSSNMEMNGEEAVGRQAVARMLVLWILFAFVLRLFCPPLLPLDFG